ncbi:AraC family transcriptional regulator [Rhodobacteraceae bacterium]|nr:AraC family transcriptional regulator [Paracoccaceae bacterium]
MHPWYEAVTIPEGQSALVFDRRLPEFGFNWHYHPEYELTLTLGSRGTRFVGSDVSPYGEGDLALIGPNLPHAWQSHHLAEGADEHRAVICWFTKDWVRGLLALMPELRAVQALLAEAEGGVLFGDAPELRARVLDLCTCPAPERAAALPALLLRLAGTPDRRTLSSKTLTPEELPRDQRRMEAVLGYLHDHLQSPIRLAPLCALAHVTESQLQRIFRRSTGQSISAYVARQRVGRACTLLTRTDLAMATIADRCGFHDAAHLSRKVRQLTGRAPSRYRKEFRASGTPARDGAFPMS